jgi:hypothetical protein
VNDANPAVQYQQPEIADLRASLVAVVEAAIRAVPLTPQGPDFPGMAEAAINAVGGYYARYSAYLDALHINFDGSLKQLNDEKRPGGLGAE